MKAAQKASINKELVQKKTIAVMGLGYVGLPLAVEFGKNQRTIGFDINASRVGELKNGHDRTLEVSDEDLQTAVQLEYTTQLEKIRNADIYIITVPTPIDENKKPDLTPLLTATAAVGKVLSKGDYVIYESTVYPGCTEEKCVPILEEVSGLKFNVGFYCGYSPERINPGDKERTLTKIRKVTSGSSPEASIFVDELYKSIITAGTYKASSLKVAEASKAIENAQRDVNIAFVNELALIFDKVGIDTIDVLKAAGTKWNFLNFRPGLVGGHCIGVDPYYLAFKANSMGYQPELIDAARSINDNMGFFISNKLIKKMILSGMTIKSSNILILGFTFKENCPDIRNTRVIDIINELLSFGCNIDVYDPWADHKEVKDEYDIEMLSELKPGAHKKYHAIILAVAHDQFNDFKLGDYGYDNSVVFDIKGLLNSEDVIRL